MKAKRNRIREDRGQAMTEFAIVLPILVVLLFGIVQFGILFNNYVTLTDAVRAGARARPAPAGEKVKRFVYAETREAGDAETTGGLSAA